MNKPIVTKKSPISVELQAGKDYYFCTCGKSANQPFCDGAHKGTSFTPMAFTAEKDGPAYLCQCKNTSNAPFCDGAHVKIPDDQVGKEFTLE